MNMRDAAILREAWQRQLVADRTILVSDLKVAIAIGWHVNQKAGGWAWPGIRTLARLTGFAKSTVILARVERPSPHH